MPRLYIVDESTIVNAFVLIELLETCWSQGKPDDCITRSSPFEMRLDVFCYVQFIF